MFLSILYRIVSSFFETEDITPKSNLADANSSDIAWAIHNKIERKKQIIQTHRRLEIGSDYIGLAPVRGIEPLHQPSSRYSIYYFLHNS